MQPILKLLAPSTCALCKRSSSEILCIYCLKALDSEQRSTPLVQTEPMKLWAWGEYYGLLERLLVLVKYDGRKDVGFFLGNKLGACWQQANPLEGMKLRVVPVPISAERRKTRGYNQTEVLAQSFCRWTGYTLDSQSLRRTRDTQAQFGLSPKARRENLQEAFLWKNSSQAQNRGVLLLDDIYTTGATLNEIHAVLTKAHVPVLGAVVMAAPRL
ncbi:MAG: ComF family protein [Gloeobacterales cyanobacterium]